MNNTKKLPDAYAKNTDSNIYKVLQLANLLYTDTKSDLISINNARSIHDAEGKTLDNYGAMLNVQRNGATDEKYRVKILYQIARNLTDADCNSVINAIAQMLGTEASNIKIDESSGDVEVIGLTLEMLETNGFTSSEISELIQQLMPVGINLSLPYYAGTLEIFQNTRFGHTSLGSEYPQLSSAWYYGQKAFLEGRQVGLKGEGTVPDEFQKYMSNFPTTGYYEGGTLGILSGEDE